LVPKYITPSAKMPAALKHPSPLQSAEVGDKSTCTFPCARAGVDQNKHESAHAATSRKNMREELLFVIILLPSNDMFVRKLELPIPYF
jgi:hypothetical protein